MCYSRPLNSSRGKVYLGIANTEGAMLPKRMNNEHGECGVSFL